MNPETTKAFNLLTAEILSNSFHMTYAFYIMRIAIIPVKFTYSNS